MDEVTASPDEPAIGVPADSAVPPARVRILDPTAAPPAIDHDPGPGPLRGRSVGLRYDTAWRSYEWVLDEWEQELVRAGARVERWLAGHRVGEEGDRTFAELGEFAAGVDVAVVGLGN
jgi:hypothetical protein